MTNSARSLSMLLLVIALVGLVTLPELAYAGPFGGGANTLKNDIIELLTPIIGIGIIALGIFCAFGKVNWMWFGAAVFGIILIFGNEQIITWVRGAFSV